MWGRDSISIEASPAATIPRVSGYWSALTKQLTVGADLELTKNTWFRSIQWLTNTRVKHCVHLCTGLAYMPPRPRHITPSFCFPHYIDGVGTAVWLVTHLYIQAAFLIAAHLAYLHSVLLYAGGCFHVLWIGPLTDVIDWYTQCGLHWVFVDYALTFGNSYLDCLPPPQR